MALTVEIPNSKFFITPLRSVHNAIEKNVPLQQCVLLKAKAGEGLYLTGLSTRTFQMTLRVPDSEVFDEGVALVPGEILWDFIAPFPDMPLSLFVDEQDAKLVMRLGGRSLKVDLFGEDPERFEELLEPMPEVVAALDAEEFCAATKKSLKLTEKSSFVTLSGSGRDVLMSTAVKNRIFNQARLENRFDGDTWSIAVQMDYLAKMPGFVGEAELHLDAKNGIFALSVGDEHMLIRQTTQDLVQETVDLLMAQTAEGYWIAKQDDLSNDLKVATAIKDRAGISMEVKGGGLFVSCAAKGRGSLKNTHALVDHDGGEGIRINFQPQLLQKTFEALDSVDVLAEILTTTMAGWGPDDPDEIFYSLRFMDRDKPDARKVVVSTLATGDDIEFAD